MRTRERVRFSIGVTQSKQVRALIAEIPEENRATVEDYPDTARHRSPRLRSGAGG